MKKISLTRFKKIINGNIVSLKGLNDINFVDNVKMFLFKKPYLAIIYSKLETVFKGVPEEKYYHVIDFFQKKGIIVPFNGDISHYLKEAISELISRYYPVETDSISRRNGKIKKLYDLYSDIVDNRDKYAQSFISVSILPFIDKITK